MGMSLWRNILAIDGGFADSDGNNEGYGASCTRVSASAEAENGILQPVLALERQICNRIDRTEVAAVFPPAIRFRV
jgi:hypothetical protein